VKKDLARLEEMLVEHKAKAGEIKVFTLGENGNEEEVR
jgi:hypothetical protein